MKKYWYSYTKISKTKAWVVSSIWWKEQGLRAALNYGHTFGHYKKNNTNYKTYLHEGKAVGIGMCMANASFLNLDL